MEIHDPSNLKLPAIKFNKKIERTLIENDPKIQSLIRSKMLLDQELFSLLLNIKSETEEIKKNIANIEDITKEGMFFWNYNKMNRRFLYRTREEFELFRKLRHASKDQKKELEKEYKKLLFEKIRKNNLSIKRKLKGKSNKIQKTLDEFEVKKRVELDILISLTIYLCPNCKKIICTERFHTTKCSCGKKIDTTSNVESIPISMLNDYSLNFINNNMWLEYGIDYLLRRKGFQTLCGIYILGHSGVEHEIDNLGDSKKENFRILCECKTKDIIVEDIFVFSGKMQDVGCSRGYFFTTSFGISKEIKQLARSENISIVESVLEKKDVELLKEIKEE